MLSHATTTCGSPIVRKRPPHCCHLSRPCPLVGISANLLTFTQQQGRPFFVSNRTKDKASFLADKGATVVDSPRELATKCSVVMSCLANDAAVQQVFDEYLQGKPKGGSLYIDCSTIYPTTAGRVLHISFGGLYLSVETGHSIPVSPALTFYLQKMSAWP